MNTANQLMPVKIATSSLLIRPVADVDEIVSAWGKYTELKSKLLSSLDYQLISGKQYVKKSGWRKLQTAFGISDEVIKEERKEWGKFFTYEITVKASTQNGRFAFGVGSCSSSERNFAHPEHDVRSTGHTRAKNRAISDLIGGGEVAAEEIESQPDMAATVSASLSSPPKWGQEIEAGRITDRQKTLLTNLIIEEIDDDDERQARLDSLLTLSKSDASEMIQEIINAKKVNNY